MSESLVLQAVRDYLSEQLGAQLEDLGAVQVDSSEYAVAVDVDGVVRYAKVKISAAKEGYDAEKVGAEYQEIAKARAEKARADAEKRAQKAAEKLAKAQAKAKLLE